MLQGIFLKTSQQEAGGNPGLAGQPNNWCQTLNLRLKERAWSSGGVRPMGAVKGVARGVAGGPSGFSPKPGSRSPGAFLLSGSLSCGCWSH